MERVTHVQGILTVVQCTQSAFSLAVALIKTDFYPPFFRRYSTFDINVNLQPYPSRK